MTDDPPTPEGSGIWTFIEKFVFQPWSSWSWQAKLIAIAAVLTVVGPIVAAARPRLAAMVSRGSRRGGPSAR